MSEANFDFLDTKADTKKEIKSEKKAERKHLNINKGIAILTVTTLISLSTFGGVMAYTNSQKTEAKNLLETVSNQTKEIQKNREELDKNSYLLSEEQFNKNIDILSNSLKNLRKNKEDGLHGYFIANENKFFIIKYDRATGQLFCLQTGIDGKREDGVPVVMSSQWVDTLVSRMKAES